MAMEGSGVFGTVLDIVSADPVFAGAVAAIVVLVVLLALRRRSLARQAGATPRAAAPAGRPVRQTTKPIDERFAALRLQTQEFEALAPPPRHFRESGRSPSSHLLRRR